MTHRIKRPRLALAIPVVVLLLVTTGCLRQRWQPTDESFRDLPAIPKQNFGRAKERSGQSGLDERSRAIESSLGIEGEPPRFFDR